MSVAQAIQNNVIWWNKQVYHIVFCVITIYIIIYLNKSRYYINNYWQLELFKSYASSAFFNLTLFKQCQSSSVSQFLKIMTCKSLYQSQKLGIVIAGHKSWRKSYILSWLLFLAKCITIWLQNPFIYSL